MFGTIVLLALLLAIFWVVFCIYSLPEEDDSSELLPSDDDPLDDDDPDSDDDETGLLTTLAPAVFNFCLFTTRLTSVALSELFLDVVADLLPSKI